jgi:sirohydrochlorin ferrochelatase
MSAMARPVLIGLAHGSRDPRAGAAVGELLAAVRLPGVAVHAAFLELTEPGLSDLLVRERITDAVVVPLLFTAAYHAGTDVPEQVSAAIAATGVRLRVAGILGLGDAVRDAVRRRAAQAGVTDDRPVLLLAVGSSRPGANEAVQAFADSWAAIRPGPVVVGFATCEPRAQAVVAGLRAAGPEPAIVPLFLAPGLLLDAVLADPAAQDLPVAATLGTELAGLVGERYRDLAG